MSLVGVREKPRLEGVDFYSKKMNIIRNENISFVFQDYNLINDLNILDNLLIASKIDKEDAIKILKMVNMCHLNETPVRFLSGGERQRLAIARALTRKSEIFLFDEPTGNLDDKNTRIIFEIMKKISKSKLVILVTHDIQNVSIYTDDIYEMQEGELVKIHSNSFQKINLEVGNSVDQKTYQVYNDVINRNNIDFVRISSSSGNEYIIKYPNNDLFKAFIEVVSKEINQYLTFNIFYTFNNNDLDLSSFNAIAKSKLGFEFIIKYCLRLFYAHKIKSFIIGLLMILSFALFFIQTSILYTSCSHIVSKAIIQSNNSLLPIELSSLNNNTLENVTLRNGKYVYDTFENKFGRHQIVQSYSMFPLTIDNSNQLSINTIVIDKEHIKFADSLEIVGNYPDNHGEIMISDFMAYHVFKCEEVIGKKLYVNDDDTVFLRNSNSNFYIISGIFQTDYKSTNAYYQYINNQDFYWSNIDELLYYYALGVINIDTYKSYNRGNIAYLDAADFTRTSHNTFNYAVGGPKIRYKMYSDQNLIFGKSANSVDEIVVSIQFLYDRGLDESSINTYFNYKDLNASPNWINYQNFINVFDIIEQVKITGITDINTSDIYVSELFFDRIIDASIYNLSTIMVINDYENSLEIIKNIHQTNSIVILDKLVPIYIFSHLLDSSFSIIMNAIQFTFFLIVLLLLGYQSGQSLLRKEKEIGIMKSLGINSFEISKIFLVYNVIFSIISALISITLGIILVKGMNMILMKSDLFNTSYYLVFINQYSFMFLGLIILCINILATISPLIRINKIDIAITIKNAIL